MKRRGMTSHSKPNRGENDLWLTPPAILHALGSFDLDPCACPYPRPWPTAREHVALPDDGLAIEWRGRVWCNPPYGLDIGIWLDRMAIHNHGTALVFARTETDAWERSVWSRGTAVTFIYGRLNFYLPDGTRAAYNAGAPSALIAYGCKDARVLENSGISGKYIRLLPCDNALV